MKALYLLVLLLSILNMQSLGQEDNAHSSHYWLTKGNEFYENKMYPQAIECYDNAINMGDDNYLAWYNKGHAYYELSNYTKAVEAYDKSIEIIKDVISTSKKDAINFNETAQNEEAFEYYGKLIRSNLRYYNASYNRGIAYSGLNKPKKAIESYKDAINITYDIKNCCKMRATINKSANYKLSSDISCNINEYVYRTWYNMGNAYYILGEYRYAADAYDEAIKINSKHYQSYYNKGNSYYMLTEYGNAVEAYDGAIRANNDHYQSFYNKGLILGRNLEKYGDAILSFNKAISLNNKSSSAWYNKGIIFDKLGIINKSIESFDRAIEIDGNNSKYWYMKGRALTQMSQHKNESGYYILAIECYTNAIHLNRSDDLAWVGKGDAYYYSNQYTEAMNSYTEAININRNNSAAWYGKGLALYKIGSYDEALVSLIRARDLKQSQEEKLIIYGAFLTIYIGILIVFIYFIYNTASSLHRFQITPLCIYIFNVLGWVTFAWIISSFFDVEKIIVFTKGGFLIALITFLLWVLFGSTVVPWKHRIKSFFKEFNYRHNKLSCSIPLIIFASVLAYPVIATFCYVNYGSNYVISSYDTNTEQGMLTLLRESLILIVFVSLLTTLPPLTSTALSKNLDKYSRNVVIILYFGYLALTMFLSLWILWSFGIDFSSNEYRIARFGDTSVNTNLLLTLFMASTVSIFLLIYLRGWKNTKNWWEKILEDKYKRLDKIQEILELHNSSKMISFCRGIEKEIENFREIEYVNRVDEDVRYTGNNLEHPRPDLYEVLTQLDPRLYYLDFLINIRGQLGGGIVDQFQSHYVEVYQSQKKDVAKLIESEKKTKPQLWIAFVSVISPILGPIFSEFVTRVGIPLDPVNVINLLSNLEGNIGM